MPGGRCLEEDRVDDDGFDIGQRSRFGVLVSAEWGQNQVDRALSRFIAPFPAQPTDYFEGWASHQMTAGHYLATCHSCTQRVMFPMRYEDTDFFDSDEES